MKRVLHLMLAACALCIALPATAVDVLGNWKGTWQQGAGGGGTFEMNVISQTPGPGGTYELIGHFDWLCTFGTTCSGTEQFAGGLTGFDLEVSGTSIDPGSVGLVLGTYRATIAPDGLTFAGTFGLVGEPSCQGCEWAGVRAPIPEPASAALLLAGLAGIAAVRRRSTRR